MRGRSSRVRRTCGRGGKRGIREKRRRARMVDEEGGQIDGQGDRGEVVSWGDVG